MANPKHDEKKKPEAEVIPPGKSAAVVIPTGDAAVAALNSMLGGKFKVARQVTLPLLKQVDNVPFAVRIQTKAKDAAKLKNDKSDRTPPKTMEVINLETGELMTLIANAAMLSGLESVYGDDGYVGKAFGMVSVKRAHKEKTMREYKILELSEV